MAYFHTAKVMTLAHATYERYKDAWLKEHITDDIITQTEAAYENDPDAVGSFADYVEENGYANGERYYSFKEFLDREYRVWAIAEDLEQYMFERGEYYYPERERVKWLGKDRETSEANIRASIVNEPTVLLDYITNDLAALSPEYSVDELRGQAMDLRNRVAGFCDENVKKNDKTVIERD